MPLGPTPSSSIPDTASPPSHGPLPWLLAGLRRLRMGSWLALAAAGLSIVLTLWNVPSQDAGIVFGGVLALVVPYAAIALALSSSSVWAQALGVALAALMAWFTSFGPAELIGALLRGDPARPTTLTFLLLTVTSLGAFGFGLRDLFRTALATGYWARSPAGAKLALLTLVFWTLVFAADSYLSGNLPLARVLMAPLQMIAFLAAALMLRQSSRAPRAAGLLITAGAGAATVAYWITYSGYLPLTGTWTSVPYAGYYTALPWPLLLSAALLLDLATLAAGLREIGKGQG
jgi:hypothetical protein